mgnify:CR=1 FL=1
MIPMKQKEPFTIKHAIEVQKRQLEQWKKVLKSNMFKRLNNYCNKCNKELLTKYSENDEQISLVFRGVDIDMFIHNNLILNNKIFIE